MREKNNNQKKNNNDNINLSSGQRFALVCVRVRGCSCFNCFYFVLNVFDCLYRLLRKGLRFGKQTNLMFIQTFLMPIQTNLMRKQTNLMFIQTNIMFLHVSFTLIQTNLMRFIYSKTIKTDKFNVLYRRYLNVSELMLT